MNVGSLRMRSIAKGLSAKIVALLVCLCGCDRAARFDVRSARWQDDLNAADVPGSVRVQDGVTLREVRFSSLSWDGESPRPIRIQAFLATPPGDYPSRSKPAVIFAHGLGGQGDPQTAIEICRNLDVVALSLSGPGLGQSEGTALTPESPRALFTGEAEIRRNWMYAYVYAILRSVTYLQTRVEVDPQAIALTGFSLGGVATFIANGVDDRIRGALPVAASGGLAQAAAAKTWLRDLLQSVPDLKPDDPGAKAFFRALDPLVYAGRQRGAVYMLIGTQDEYFPLEQALQTYAAVRAPQKSLTLVPDYDHGWYFGGGCPAECMPGGPRSADCPPAPICPSACPSGSQPPYCGPQASYNREADFSARWSLLLRALVAQHVAHPPRPFQPPPLPPLIESSAGETVVKPASPVAAVRLAISDDCGYTFRQIGLARSPDGAFRHQGPVGPSAIVIAEVESSEGVVATSVPSWPPSCRVQVRPFGPRPSSAPSRPSGSSGK